MKRIVLLAVLFLFVGATSAFAQAPPQSNPSTTGIVTTSGELTKPAVSKAPGIFSKESIEKAVARSPAVVPQTKKPFLKTPWPYVIAAAAIILIIIGTRDRAY